jgi:hypothetical protein
MQAKSRQSKSLYHQTSSCLDVLQILLPKEHCSGNHACPESHVHATHEGHVIINGHLRAWPSCATASVANKNKATGRGKHTRINQKLLPEKEKEKQFRLAKHDRYSTKRVLQC